MLAYRYVKNQMAKLCQIFCGYAPRVKSVIYDCLVTIAPCPALCPHAAPLVSEYWRRPWFIADNTRKPSHEVDPTTLATFLLQLEIAYDRHALHPTAAQQQRSIHCTGCRFGVVVAPFVAWTKLLYVEPG